MQLKTITAALSPLSLLNGLAATAPVATTTDVSYGPTERHKLDIYGPRSGSDLPVAVFFYGGGWEEGDRDMYRFVGAALAEAGIVTVIPDYRVYPQVRFPGFLEDGARAVRWTRDNAAAFGADAGRLVLIGHSAGAHIAAMLALDPQWLQASGIGRSAVRGLVGLAGPYDFVPDTDTRRIIFGLDSNRSRTQPISFARADAPPALLVSGSNDKVVDPGNSSRLAARLNAEGASVRAEFYPHVSHESLIGSFSPALRFLAPAFRHTERFVKEATAGRQLGHGEAA